MKIVKLFRRFDILPLIKYILNIYLINDFTTMIIHIKEVIFISN